MDMVLEHPDGRVQIRELNNGRVIFMCKLYVQARGASMHPSRNVLDAMG
jgi:hypothetical protein